MVVLTCADRAKSHSFTRNTRIKKKSEKKGNPWPLSCCRCFCPAQEFEWTPISRGCTYSRAGAWQNYGLMRSILSVCLSWPRSEQRIKRAKIRQINSVHARNSKQHGEHCNSRDSLIFLYCFYNHVHCVTHLTFIVILIYDFLQHFFTKTFKDKFWKSNFWVFMIYWIVEWTIDCSIR